MRKQDVSKQEFWTVPIDERTRKYTTDTKGLIVPANTKEEAIDRAEHKALIDNYHLATSRTHKTTVQELRHSTYGNTAFCNANWVYLEDYEDRFGCRAMNQGYKYMEEKEVVSSETQTEFKQRVADAVEGQ